MAGPMFPRPEREIYYRNINHIQGGRMYFLLLFNIGMDDCKVSWFSVPYPGEIQLSGKDGKLNSFSICPTIVQSRFPP